VELKDVVKQVISGLEKRQEEESAVIKAWQNAVGKKAAAHTKPVLFKGKKLVINVSDSSWLYKLTLEKKRIIKIFNENAKTRKKAEELQFRIGEI